VIDFKIVPKLRPKNPSVSVKTALAPFPEENESTI